MLTVLAGFFALLAAYLGYRLQKKQKVVEYDIYSMSLIRFKPSADRGLSVTVKKSLLTGDPTDAGEPVRIDSAYGFRVSLRNVGNDPIEKPQVEVLMDDNAKILEFWTDPTDRPGYPVVQTHVPGRNMLLLSFPYLNPKESVSISITSTGNKEPKCDLKVLGVGIRTVSMNTRYFFWIRTALVATLAATIVEAVFLVNYVREAKEATIANPDVPTWQIVILAIFVVVVIGVAVKGLKVVSKLFEPGFALVRSRLHHSWNKEEHW